MINLQRARDDPDDAAITGELAGVQHMRMRLVADAAAKRPDVTAYANSYNFPFIGIFKKVAARDQCDLGVLPFPHGKLCVRSLVTTRLRAAAAL